VADATRRLNPYLAAARGEHEFIAALDGRDVAISAMFTRRRVGWLGGATVLPEARGAGIQRALLADRIRRAADAGCHRVLATADVGSVSAANLEALGLRRIWTRALYRLDPAAEA
jgi:GNAT superfamily N-acetyltransferase